MKISRTELKIAAMATMLIDHIGQFLMPHTGALYIACRVIGRISMPLFAFMIAQGAVYTKSRSKYVVRLIVCAFAAMLAYNLLDGDIFKWNPNVVFTYALASGGICAYEKSENRYGKLLILAATTAISFLLQLEYSISALLLVWFFFFIRNFVQWRFYIGEGSPSMPNWVCYVFYPGHLLLIYLIRCLIRI